MKQLLLIGINPFTLDFSLPAFPPGMTAEFVMNGIKSEQERLLALNYNLETYLPDLEQTDMTPLIELLQNKQYEAIIIGAGIRVPAPFFLLFERYINVVHEHAPKSKILFNTQPADNVEAVQRWL